MTLDDLVAEARPHVPGAPDATIKDHLRHSMIRFCRDTRFWEEEVDPVYPVAGISRYQLELPEDSEIYSVKSATQDGLPVAVDVNVFGLMKALEPLGSAPVRVTAILAPSPTAEQIPPRLVSSHRQGVVAGAVETLISMPGMEWSNPGLLAYHAGKFIEHVADAKLKISLGHSGPPHRVRPFTGI